MPAGIDSRNEQTMNPRKDPLADATHVQLIEEGLSLLDQRRLPGTERYLRYRTAAAVATAIRKMVVRGAPAIGIAAAYGYALEARRGTGTRDRLDRRLVLAAGRLRAARPTAVNLDWAISRMERVGSRTRGGSRALGQRLEEEARRIHREDIAANRRLGRFGSALLPRKATILTHCNAGALATGGYGTALGVIRAAVESGRRIEVLADETRPLLQGARLTAFELAQDGIPVTLIADSAAGWLMKQGIIDAVVVGADRIARNGDVANKIGTYTAACLAHRHGIPFYVAAPISTIDLETRRGEEIPIEERDPGEVLTAGGRRIAPASVSARNPAFDVTESKLVSAIITERGVVRPPYSAGLKAIVSRRP